MKAKIKATGEIAEFSTGKNLQGETILLKVGTASIFSLNEVELVTDTDWQQVHIQAAIAALNGLTSNPSFEGHTLEDVVAECVTLADALIVELKKGGQDE